MRGHFPCPSLEVYVFLVLVAEDMTARTHARETRPSETMGAPVARMPLTYRSATHAEIFLWEGGARRLYCSDFIVIRSSMLSVNEGDVSLHQ